MPVNIGCSWSGGKDSCFALMQAVKEGHQLKALINMMNEHGKISRSHGLPHAVLQDQARQMDVPILAIPASWEQYKTQFVEALQQVKTKFGVQAMVFGDIDLQQHRDWEEMVCAEAGLEALLPLWQQDRRKLVFDMMEAGIEAMIVSCNTQLGPGFLAKMITPQLVTELEKAGVDVCGENGEFHTVVLNCPLFRGPVTLPASEKVLHEGYWFLDWYPAG